MNELREREGERRTLSLVAGNAEDLVNNKFGLGLVRARPGLLFLRLDMVFEGVRVGATESRKILIVVGQRFAVAG